jgi:hypothetical protein
VFESYKDLTLGLKMHNWREPHENQPAEDVGEENEYVRVL